MLGVIDAEAKEVRFGGFFTPSGSYEEDFPLILKHYEKSRGIVAKNGLQAYISQKKADFCPLFPSQFPRFN